MRTVPCRTPPSANGPRIAGAGTSAARIALLVAAISLLHYQPSHAQSSLHVSGSTFFDYQYVIASPDSGEAGDNGFSYRRLYLTTDYQLSDTFSGRARLEVSGSSTTARGRPSPFVKDLYVRWHNALGEGHTLTLGVSPTPSFDISQRFWGYRSLEGALLNRNGVVASRDMGLAVHGPLHRAGLGYALMIGNNEGVNQERNETKRIYGQLIYRSTDGRLTATTGVDYAGYSDDRARGLNAPVFVGYRASIMRVGLEGFVNRIRHRSEAVTILQGGSLFGIVAFTQAWEAIVRYDRFVRSFDGARTVSTYMIFGARYRAFDGVNIIPNTEWSRRDDASGWRLNARLTVHVDFRQ